MGRGRQTAEVLTESAPAAWNAESWGRNFPLGCGPRLEEREEGKAAASPLTGLGVPLRMRGDRVGGLCVASSAAS